MKFKRLSYACGSGKPLVAKTLGDLVRDAARRHPSSDACVFPHQGVKMSYQELLHKSEEVANGLLSLGLPKQSRVGLFSANCQEWLLTKFACAMSGLILVNLNPAYRRQELQFALRNVECEALVTNAGFRGADYLRMINDICPELASSKVGGLQSNEIPSLKWVIRTDDGKTPGMLNFKDLYGKKAANYAEYAQSVGFEDPVNIQFTSGTTGSPKGAVLTHHNIVNNGIFMNHLMRFSEKDRACIPLPLYHCYGMVAGAIACLSACTTMVFPDYGFNPASVLAAVEKEKCTTLYGVPTMFQAVMNEQLKSPREISSLKKGVLGGASATPEQVRRIISELGIKNMICGYGMTESSPVATSTLFEDNFEKIVSTIGVVWPHTEVKLVDRNNRTVAQGETGELCIRGYLVMKEYWKNLAGTKDAIDERNWLHSGDLAVFDNEMYLKIVGRKKDMIIRGGENVFPAEVEAFFNTHPDIDEIHVIGVPDEYYGELVCAWIKMKPGKSPLTAEDLKTFAEGKVAYYKIPSLVRVVDSFPLTVTGKVMKYVMREEESKKRRS